MTHWTEFVKAVKHARTIAVVTHVIPDPDAIGSASGLALALDALDKNVLILCDDPVPENLHYLPAAGWFLPAMPADQKIDLVIGVDASDLERLGQVIQPLVSAGVRLANIDHHITNLYFGDINIVDTECAATAQLLVSVIDALGVKITTEIAECLMAGLVGDTRAFATPSVTPHTLAIAARLMEQGANLSSAIEEVFNKRSIDRLKLWGIALANMAFQEGVIWSVVSNEERRQHGVENASEAGISNLLLSAGEAQVSASAVEKADGRVEFSFRARPGYDVSQIALSLGGGGHVLASGCTIDGPVEAAVERVIELLKAEVRDARQE